MLKRVLKRVSMELFIAILLFSLLAMILVPNAAFAGISGALSDQNISLSEKGSGTWEVKDGTGITGSVTGTAGGGCSSAKSSTATLVIKNASDKTETLYFGFKATPNGGSVQIGEETYTSLFNGDFETELAPGASVNIVITSAEDEKTTSVDISDIQLGKNENPSITFAEAEHGSYTVDGESISETQTFTKAGAEGYLLETGEGETEYEFMGWYLDDKLLSTDVSYSFFPTKDGTISAKFSKASDPMLGVGSKVYFSWDEAISEAESSDSKVITLLRNGVMEGDYTIPSGVTLLIPFDDANTCYTTKPGIATTGTRKEYRKLTINGTLTVASGGAISVSAAHSSQQPNVGAVVGAYSHIELSDSGRIDLQSGASLYAYGYITGDGLVQANPGAQVYEYFQIRDWRGGSCTSQLNKASEKVFPFSQYYIQNIEAPLKLYKGAQLKGYTSIYAAKTNTSAEISFIGDGGLYMLTDENSYLIKRYDKTNDRLYLDVNGGLNVNEISLNVKLSIISQTVHSSDYVLPINGNISIIMRKGTMHVNEDMSLLPGAEITIEEGSELEVTEGADLFVYDREEWIGKGYITGNRDFYAAAYVANQQQRYTRTANDLKDAKIDINGTMTANGGVYTTAGGGNIISSKGTGQFVLSNAVDGSRKLHEITQSNTDATFHEIAITPAQLCNADETFTEITEGKAGYIYTYNKGKWSAGSPIASVDAKDYEKEGIFEGDKSVDLRIEGVAGAEIRYTTDGSNPTADSSLYENPIALKCDSDKDVEYTIKAAAYKDGKQIGPVVTYKYTITSGHKYGKWECTAAPTEMTEGTLERTCSICEETESVTLPVLSEDSQEYDVAMNPAPTCTEGGISIYTYKTETEEAFSFEVELSAAGHIYSEWEIDTKPTQLAPGHMSRRCIGCEDIYEEEILPMLSEDDYTCVRVTEPNCTDTGLDRYTLKNDESVMVDISLEALGHSKRFVEEKAATCEKDGIIAHLHCQRCDGNFDEDGNEVQDVTITALGHNYGAWKVTVNPTEEAAGVLTRVCARGACGNEETKTLPVLGSEAYVVKVDEPSCTEAGEAVYRYTADGQDFVFKMILDAKGHDYGKLIEGKAATCEEDGILAHYTCSACHMNFDEDYKEMNGVVIEKLGHKAVADEAVEATCAATGLTEGSHCEVCGLVLKAQKIVPKTEAHTPVDIEETAATCVKDGKTAGSKCSVCDKVLIESEVVPATGKHIYENGICRDCGAAEPSIPVGPVNPPVDPNPGPTEPTTPVEPQPPTEIEDPDTPLGPLPDEEVITAVQGAKIKLTSKLTKLNGKKAIKVTWTVPKNIEDIGLDGYEVYKSTKRYSGFGKTPYFKTTTKKNYINNKELKKGRTYYYKVRGYKVVGDQKIYTPWSTKAWRRI